MHAPTDAALMEVWEQGQGHSPTWRALLLLGLAHPHATLDDLARLDVGSRDAELMELRERWLGRRLDAFTPCPACGAELEFTLDLSELRAQVDEPAQRALTREAGEYTVSLRLPDSLDLLAMARCSDVAGARRELLRRCVASVTHRGERMECGELPEALAACVGEWLGELSRADVELALDCAGCGGATTVLFDPGAYLWTELNAWARRILREVHALATAYGWTEREVLSLGPRRRRTYLEMVAA